MLGKIIVGMLILMGIFVYSCVAVSLIKAYKREKSRDGFMYIVSVISMELLMIVAVIVTYVGYFWG